MGFGKLEKKLLIGGLLAAMVFGCSDETSPIEPVKKDPAEQTPTNPPSGGNHPPVFASSPLAVINENDDYSYQVQAKDTDGNKIIFSMTNAPSWISISNEGLVKGRVPEVVKDEFQSISISASDGKANAQQNYNLSIKNLFNNHIISQPDMPGITIGENSISFATPVDYAAGDFVAAGITDKTPEGLLRKVVSVSQDKRKVSTQQGTLDEAAKYGLISYSGSLSPAEIASSSMLNGMVFLKSQNPNDLSFVVNFKDVVLYDADGNEDTKTDQLIANGKLSFSADFDFSFTIENHSVANISFKNKTIMNSQLTISSNLLGLSNVLETKVAEFKLKPLVAGYLPTVPPIPVILVPHVGIYAGIDPSKINPLSLSVKENAILETSVSYWGGSLIPGFDFTNDFEFSNPVLDKEIDLSVYTGPNIDVLLYGIAGPFAGIRGKIRLHSTDKKWEIYGGLEALLGIKTDILSKHVSVQTQQAIHDEKLIAQGQKSISPTDSIKIQPGAEGKDAAVGYVLWPDGTKSYSGEGESPSMELKYDYPGSHGSEKEGLLEFSLSQIPSNATIDLATLRFTGWATQNSLNNLPTIYLSKLKGQWSESSVKWNTKPSSKAVTSLDFTNEGAISQYEVDVTEVVKEWLSDGSNYGFGFSAEGGVHGEIYSSDNSEASKRPVLVIKYH